MEMTINQVQFTAEKISASAGPLDKLLFVYLQIGKYKLFNVEQISSEADIQEVTAELERLTKLIASLAPFGFLFGQSEDGKYFGWLDTRVQLGTDDNDDLPIFPGKFTRA